MVDVLDGYAFHIVCRYGLSAQTPALVLGELGFDTDTKVLRIGNDSRIPEKIMTTNSNIAFDYSSIPQITFKHIKLASGGTLEGINLSALSGSAPGIVALGDDGKLKIIQLTSGDASVSITYPDGLYGNPDIRSTSSSSGSGSGSGGLSSVATTTSFTGNGTSTSPLTLAQAQTSRIGGAKIATASEALIGIEAEKIITPSLLAYVLNDASTIRSASDTAKGAVQIASTAEALSGTNNSNVLTPYLLAQVLASSSISIATTSSFTGDGSTAVPLALVQATDTILGGVIKATDAEAIAGIDDQKYITPFVLKAQFGDYAPKNSPSFVGTPETVSPAAGDSSLRIANTQWVNNAIAVGTAALVNAAPATLDTLNELAAAIGNDPNFAVTYTTALANKLDNTRAINTVAPLQGGGSLVADLNLSLDPSYFDALYASLSTTITGSGLITGGGSLASNRVLTVNASTNAQVAAGTDTTSAVTPAALAYRLSLLPTYTPETRAINTSGLITGGADLTADITLTVDPATNADAITGTSTTVVMTPAATAAAYLALTGGTLTGPITISPTSGDAKVTLNRSATGLNSEIVGTVGGLTRWTEVLGDSSAETGSNVGSDYKLTRSDDAGAVIDSPVTVERSTGDVYVLHKLFVQGSEIDPLALGLTASAISYATI